MSRCKWAGCGAEAKHKHVKKDGTVFTELCDEHEKEFNEYLTSHDILEIREIWKKAGCDHMLKRPPIPEKGWVQACCYCTKQVDFPVKCTIDGKIVAMSDSCSSFKLMQA